MTFSSHLFSSHRYPKQFNAKGGRSYHTYQAGQEEVSHALYGVAIGVATYTVLTKPSLPRRYKRGRPCMTIRICIMVYA